MLSKQTFDRLTVVFSVCRIPTRGTQETSQRFPLCQLFCLRVLPFCLESYNWLAIETGVQLKNDENESTKTKTNMNKQNITFLHNLRYLYLISGLQIGFSASGNTSSRSLIVQFDSVKTNYGYRYSPITGKFTCSHPGLYYFSASLIKERNIPHFFGFVACHIKRNSEFLLGTVIDPTNDDTDIGTYETSAFLTVHLSRGDQVYVKCYSSLDIHSSFSGFLIQSD